MPRKHSFFWLAALSVGAIAPALAQEEEDEIVVTAPLESARIESLQGATSLNRDEIVENLEPSLGDMLDRQPGIASSAFGAGASRPIIRGLGEDRVRVLQNGVGAIDASTASPDHAVTADGLDAERIEVLRGAAALAYGGNAVGGVVNVIDQSIPTRRSERVDAAALAGMASVDQARFAAANAGLGAGSLQLHLSASARDAEPYNTPAGQALNQFAQHLAYSAGASLVHDWGYAGLAGKRTENQYGLLTGGRIDMEQTRFEMRGDARVDLGFFDGLDFAAQRSEYQHTEFENNGEAGTRFSSEGYETRLEAHHRNGAHRGVTGIQISDVDLAAVGAEAFLSATAARDFGVFAIERWDSDRWGLEGGLRGERRELDNLNFGARDFDSFSVSLGAFWRPAEHWFLGGTLARTERAPTAVELFSDGPHLATESYEVGDAGLQRETALSFEASLRFARGAVRFEASAFALSFSDYIALLQRGDVFWLDEIADTSGFSPSASDPAIPAGAEILPVFHFSVRDAQFVGGEISIAAPWFEAAGWRVNWEAAFDFVQASFDAGGHPPRIPPASLRFGLNTENEFWSGGVEIVAIAEQNRLAPFETKTEGFTMLNAGLGWRPRGGELTLRLDGRNLTDQLGRVHSSFLKQELAMPGRDFRISLRAEF